MLVLDEMFAFVINVNVILVLIHPYEFMLVQDNIFASVNNVITNLFYLSIVLVVIIFVYFLRYYKYLDVIALGKDQATNLGVPYNYFVKRLLIISAVLIS